MEEEEAGAGAGAGGAGGAEVTTLQIQPSVPADRGRDLLPAEGQASEGLLLLILHNNPLFPLPHYHAGPGPRVAHYMMATFILNTNLSHVHETVERNINI